MSAPPPGEREATLVAGVALFDAGRYLAAHELFEELWESTEGQDADFYKGLVQAAIALHHLQSGNLEGARRLHASHRALLARYQPAHLGLEVTRFLAAMQLHFQHALEASPVGTAAGVRVLPRLGPRQAEGPPPRAETGMG